MYTCTHTYTHSNAVTISQKKQKTIRERCPGWQGWVISESSDIWPTMLRVSDRVVKPGPALPDDTPLLASLPSSHCLSIAPIAQGTAAITRKAAEFCPILKCRLWSWRAKAEMEPSWNDCVCACVSFSIVCLCLWVCMHVVMFSIVCVCVCVWIRLHVYACVWLRVWMCVSERVSVRVCVWRSITGQRKKAGGWDARRCSSERGILEKRSFYVPLLISSAWTPTNLPFRCKWRSVFNARSNPFILVVSFTRARWLIAIQLRGLH